MFIRENNESKDRKTESHVEQLKEEIANLRAQLDSAHKSGFEAGELANRLAAELEALKPKPVVDTMFIQMRLTDMNTQRRLTVSALDRQVPISNLKLIFHDAVLVAAEVIK